jgi:hypothetical protein
MKGQQKISRGVGFRGALNYDIDHDQPQIVGGNMAGANARELASEFGQSRRIRSDIQKPVWRNSLSLPKGETLDAATWTKIADDYMAELGFLPMHQRVYVLHNKPGQQHVHITASRISLAGRVYLGQNENLKSTRIIHSLEKKYGLTPTLGNTTPKPRRTPKKGEIEKSLRTQIKPDRVALADLVDKVLLIDKPKNPESLKTALAARGVETEFFTENEKIKGIAFRLNGLKFSGSALGQDYKFPRLVERMKHDTTIKTSDHTKPALPPGNVTGRPNPESPSPKNPAFGKKGLRPRNGRRATKTENQAFQLLQMKGKNMENEKQEMIGALSHARSAQAEDGDNVEHGWTEWVDRNGRTWFYDADQPPAVGNRAGYSWDPSGSAGGPPAIRVWDCAVERHGVEQAAIDAVRICVFKSLPEPLKLHGTAEFQKFAAREMFRLNIELENKEGAGRIEYDRLTREKEKDTQEQVNAISSVFSQIDDQAKASHRAAIHRAAADMEDTPSKKDDDRMRMRGPRQ